MEFHMRPTNLPPADIGMDFEWQPDVYDKFIGNSQYALSLQNTSMHVMPAHLNVEPSFGEDISSKPATPFSPECGILGNIEDPTSLWPASMDRPDLPSKPTTQASVQPCDTLGLDRGFFSRSSLSCSPLTIAQRRSIAEAPPSSMTPPTSTPASMPSYARLPSVQVSTPASSISDSAVSASPIESDKTRRARYAANQRHSKAKQARKDSQQGDSTDIADTRAAERKQRHREKNKVAAAKCRSSQRKQVQILQNKGSRLDEKNLQLKTMIQELRGELNSLRSMALDHQECACPVAQYNHHQAERVIAEYRSACLGQGFGGLARSPEQRVFPTH